ncbi:MAG: condensation domain-containing protein, partial [Xanthomonadaceae bacterium]|nr:condensation domain-containing protein [Xanthomonadaceae bacterium]
MDEAVVLVVDGALRAYLAGRETPNYASWIECHLPEPLRPSVSHWLEAFPLTANGKVDRQALRALQLSVVGEQRAPRNAVEEQLLGIWRTLLKQDDLGIDDNFFAVGGDSIITIQLVARARQAGIVITPQQVFETQTVAGLAAVSDTRAVIEAEQGQVVGDVPLSPTQRAFLNQVSDDATAYVRNRVLRARQPLDIEWLGQVVDFLLRRHDSLRLRFERQGDSWRQYAVHSETLSLHDHWRQQRVEGTDKASVDEALNKAIRQAAADFDLSQGPLFRLVYVQTLDGSDDQLLVLAHYLVMDGVSWRILLQDLANCYARLVSRGDTPAIVKTSSYREWSHTLATVLDTVGSTDQPEPGDVPFAPGKEGQALSQRFCLSENLTKALRSSVHEAYGTQTEDLLLAALHWALAQRLPDARLAVAVESHGRQGLDDRLDVSQTTGWFAVAGPISSPLSGVHSGTARAAVDCAGLIQATKEQLRRAPLTDHVARAVANETDDHPWPKVFMSYLGQFDQVVDENPYVALSDRWLPPHRPAGAARSYALEFSFGLIDGVMQGELLYPGVEWEASQAHALTAAWVSALEALVTHCRTSDGGYTPSDFPLLETDSAGLAQCLSRVPAAWRPRRGIEYLSPLPRRLLGMLAQSLNHPGSGVYNVQNVFELKGRFDANGMHQAWTEVLARHQALRSSATGIESETPLWVCLRQLELPWLVVDWRARGIQRQERDFEARLKHYLHRDFDLNQPPLMRLHCLRMADQRTRLIWEHHHAICDGWSAAILWQEVFDCYARLTADEPLALAPAASYQSYLEWLAEMDGDSSRAFWQRTLSGGDIHGGCPLPGLANACANDRIQQPAEREWLASRELSTRLDKQARIGGVTLNILCQAAWALLLARTSDSRDVLFGMTMAGRSPAVPRIEDIVGLCLNSVPVRARVDDRQTLADFFLTLAEHVAVADHHAHLALGEITEAAGLPRGQAPFESLLVFENLPEAVHLHGESGELAIQRLNGYSYNHYPLTLMLVGDERLYLKVKYDQARFNGTAIEYLLDAFEQALWAVSQERDTPLSALPMLSAAAREHWLTAGRCPAVTEAATLTERFESAVKRRPDHPALVTSTGTLSYT